MSAHETGLPSQSPRPSPSPSPGHTGDLTEAELATQRKLKAVVIGLGILILLSFAGVVAGMAYRASQIGKPLSGGGVGNPATRPGVTAAALQLQTLQPDVRLALPQGSTVKSATLQASRLLVHHEGPGGAGLIVLDLATGQVVSRITFETASGR